MATPAEPTVFVVDDDPAVRESLAMLLDSAGHRAACFETAGAFLDAFDPAASGCAIIDLRLPGIDGLELQDELRARGACLPVVFLTGHADVPAAVQALKHGAMDFVQKPFDADSLLGLVGRALEADAEQRAGLARREAAEARLADLTPREREVMALVVDGLASKVIAADLGISERTVELHRSHIMRKTGARSVPALIRMLQWAEE